MYVVKEFLRHIIAPGTYMYSIIAYFMEHSLSYFTLFLSSYNWIIDFGKCVNKITAFIMKAHKFSHNYPRLTFPLGPAIIFLLLKSHVKNF